MLTVIMVTDTHSRPATPTIFALCVNITIPEHI